MQVINLSNVFEINQINWIYEEAPDLSDVQAILTETVRVVNQSNNIKYKVIVRSIPIGNILRRLYDLAIETVIGARHLSRLPLGSTRVNIRKP